MLGFFDASLVVQVLVFGIALLIAAIVGGFLVIRLRRRTLALRETGGEGFSLESLEAMLAQGTISKDEFRRLRVIAMGLAGASGNPGARKISEPGSSAPPATDDETRNAANGIDN